MADARNTIHDLETKLGHERLARDEVTQRINAERLQIEEALTAVQEDLATERALRAGQNANATKPPLPRRPRTASADDGGQGCAHLQRPSLSDQPRRRRGRPPKVAREIAPDDSEIVEWWSPGWQEKYR